MKYRGKMVIEADRFYTTRVGQKVRIYATDGVGVHSVHGAIQMPDGWWILSWCKNGELNADAESNDDIVSPWEPEE